jgi:TfoX/Sxy family transcriptional regulator of competence genes
MAYNEELAQRIRERIFDLPQVNEKEMFGGLVFIVNEKMCIGVIKDEMMCRIDPERHHVEVEKNGCRTMDFTKKPMLGYIMIEESGMKSKNDFDYWINLALEFNQKAKASKKKQKK